MSVYATRISVSCLTNTGVSISIKLCTEYKKGSEKRMCMTEKRNWFESCFHFHLCILLALLFTVTSAEIVLEK